MDAKTRRTENNLITLGSCVIALGLWSFIKFVIQLLSFSTSERSEWISEENSFIATLAVWLFSVILLLLQIHVGFSARAEGNGKRRGVLYLITSVFIVLVYALTILAEIAILILFQEAILSLTVTIIIDSTCMIFILEVIVNAVTIRRLRKHTGEKEES